MNDLKILDIEQGSEEWLSTRAGIVTASEAGCLLVKGKHATGLGDGAITYAYTIAAEKITGKPKRSFNNAAMQLGKELEPVARDLYKEISENPVDECGIMLRLNAGYSPDGIIRHNGLIEIKTREPHLQAELLYTLSIPTNYFNQIQFGLLISQREWCDLVVYCPGMPLFINRIEPDEKIQIAYKDKLVVFQEFVEGIIKKIA